MINNGSHPYETSDFALSELIVFNDILHVSEIKCIEDYVADKYALPLTSSPTTSYVQITRFYNSKTNHLQK